MRHGRGFTLIELVLTLLVICIIAANTAPAFALLLEQQRVGVAGRDFLRGLMFARTKAGYRNARMVVTYRENGWGSGWLVYEDSNRNGRRDADETILYEHGPLDRRIRVVPGKTVRDYIGYGGNGFSVHANNAFFADTITFCPTLRDAKGLRLTIARSGRVRTDRVDMNSPPCAQAVAR